MWAQNCPLPTGDALDFFACAALSASSRSLLTAPASAESAGGAAPATSPLSLSSRMPVAFVYVHGPNTRRPYGTNPSPGRVFQAPSLSGSGLASGAVGGRCQRQLTT